QAERRAKPVVERFFQIRQIDGLVDVLIGVEVAPADLDALFVHGRIGYAPWIASRARSRSSRAGGGGSARRRRRGSCPREPRSRWPTSPSTTTRRGCSSRPT